MVSLLLFALVIFSVDEGDGDDDGFGLKSKDHMVVILRSCGVPGNDATLKALASSTCTVVSDTKCPLQPWGGWEACSISCGGVGTQVRRRHIVGCARDLRDTRQCVAAPCPQPIDCVWAWSSWSACSHTCGNGKMQRSKIVQVRAQNGGQACSGLQMHTAPCHKRPCGQHDCQLSAWPAWKVCTQTCGGLGTRMRVRSIIVAPTVGGKECGRLFESEQCGSDAPCTTPSPRVAITRCTVSQWSAWSACTTSCYRSDRLSVGAPQVRHRSRSIVVRGTAGTCPGLVMQMQCAQAPCPFDCTLTSWGAWSSCTSSCGEGFRKQTREVKYPAEHGGANCSSVLVRFTPCNSETRCPVDCKFGQWSPWSPCTKTCGLGERRRSRPVQVKAAFGGRDCDTQAGIQTSYCPAQRKCRERNVKVQLATLCTLSRWSSWTPCSASCNGGYQRRTRSITNAKACDCSVALKGNSHWRRRLASLTKLPAVANHGLKQSNLCPELEQSRMCKTVKCEIAICQVSHWGHWSVCSETGTQHRSRMIMQMPTRGEACPPLTAVRRCTRAQHAAMKVHDYHHDIHVQQLHVHRTIARHDNTTGTTPLAASPLVALRKKPTRVHLMPAAQHAVQGRAERGPQSSCANNATLCMSITIFAGFVFLLGGVAAVKLAMTAARDAGYDKVVSSADSRETQAQFRASTEEGHSLLQVGATEPTTYYAEPLTCPQVSLKSEVRGTNAIIQLQKVLQPNKEEQDALSNSMTLQYASGDDDDVV